MGRWYVGRTPNSDANLAPKSFADTAIAAQVPTVTFVRNKISLAINTNNLVTQAYINGVNAGRAQKTTVDAADALYVPATQLNAAGGVAGLDADGDIFSSQLPAGTPTEYTAKAYDVYADGDVLINTTRTVITSNPRELRIATLPIPDPGYPWRPIPFAVCQGGDPGATDPGTRLSGTHTYGLLTVIPPLGVSDQVYGAGICTDTFAMNFYQCLPYAAGDQTPTNVPAIIGARTLDLCGSCWTGSGYKFNAAGLQYWVLCVPAI